MKRTAFQEINKFGSFLKNVAARNDRMKFLKYRFRWNYLPKFHIVSSFPTHVDLETTNKCNLRCVMCPHGFPTPEFKNSLGAMDVELARQIIDEGSRKGLASLKLNWRGEPLLWRKHLVEIIQYAKKRGVIDVLLNTNGLLLDDELSRDIVLSGLDVIVFSIDGDSRLTYEEIRKGGNFDRLVHNIQRFVEIRNSLKMQKPLIRIQMVKMDSNVHEVDGVVKRWSSLVDSITFQDYTNRGEQSGRLSTAKEDFAKVGRRACPQLWQRIIITWDGKVVMCCRDWESENVLGKIDYSAGNDIEYFWRGKKLNSIRQLHLNDKLDAVTACSKCTYKESYRWQKKKGE